MKLLYSPNTDLVLVDIWVTFDREVPPSLVAEKLQELYQSYKALYKTAVTYHRVESVGAAGQVTYQLTMEISGKSLGI